MRANHWMPPPPKWTSNKAWWRWSIFISYVSRIHEWCPLVAKPRIRSGRILRYYFFYFFKIFLLIFNGIWRLWPWKVGQIKNPSDMSCSPMGYTYSSNLVILGQGVTELLHQEGLQVVPPSGQMYNQNRPNIELIRDIHQSNTFQKFGCHIPTRWIVIAHASSKWTNGTFYTIWPLWPWKVGQIKNPSDIMSSVLRYTYHINLVMPSQSVSEILRL